MDGLPYRAMSRGGRVEEGSPALFPAHVLIILGESAVIVRVGLSRAESSRPSPNALSNMQFSPHCSVKHNEGDFALLF